MKRYLFVILLAGLVFSLSANVEPDWVSHYKQTGSIKSFKKYYFGVGVSDKSERAADEIARERFGQSLETKVESEVNRFIKERNGKVTDEISKKIKIRSDIGQKGISFAGRYYDGEKYYSLIKYKKSEYNDILREEVKLELERQKIELDKLIARNRLEEEQERENIRNKQEKVKIREALLKTKEEIMLQMRNKYPEYFNSAPPFQAVSFRNGQLIPYNNQLSIKGGLFPMSLDEVMLGCKVWLFEFSGTASFEDNKYQQQELQLKYQIMPYSGIYNKFSAAFGFTGYKVGLVDSSFADAYMLITPFLAGNITLPDWYFSFGSIYADLSKTALALNNYIFYRHLKDRISIILEVNYIYDEHLRNAFNDAVVFQPAIRFKTTDNLSTTFSYEDNQLWKISLGIGF
ncbi:MAG: hypothetical protein K9M99_10225 [Candidatus Cloacimonetes bacterium]|nr:hypothetical protein [Candidatus Cloacimonadota bacterium]